MSNVGFGGEGVKKMEMVWRESMGSGSGVVSFGHVITQNSLGLEWVM